MSTLIISRHPFLNFNILATLNLSVRNVHKSYRFGNAKPLHILKGIHIDLPEQGVVSIQGQSGCGKSTLLHLLAGLDRPDSGSISWDNEKISSWNKSRLATWRNASVGFIFQAYHLLPELTALENVALPAALGRRSSEKAHALLEQVGLWNRFHHTPRELSGGEQQRVAVARALMNDPPLLFADEPTGNLDTASATGVIDLLLDLVARKKKCLIIVTHDERIASLAETKFKLSEGILKVV